MAQAAQENNSVSGKDKGGSGDGFLAIVGLNHRSAPIEVRDRAAVSEMELDAALNQLRALPEVDEVAVLSTCNRTEICAWGAEENPAGALPEFLALRTGLAPAELAKHLYILSDREAVSHLFRVAAGLDSMILGEPQILGQVKDAWRAAVDRGAAKHALSAVFESALRAARRVRSETGIARGAVSISYSAVELARQIFGDLAGREILVLGAGKMSRQTVDNIRQQGARACFVANRSRARAEELAAEFGAEVHPWERLDEALGRVDIVISSTAAPHYIVTADMVRSAMRRRRSRPLFIVDIAVPRDVEPATDSISNVFLFNIDDLKSVMEENIARRAEELPQAEEILAGEVVKFCSRARTDEAHGAILQLREWAETQRMAEFDRLRKRLPGLTPEQIGEIEEFGHRLMNKFLDRPSRRLKSAHHAQTFHLADAPPAESHAGWMTRSLRHLFGLDEVAPSPGARHEMPPAMAMRFPDTALEAPPEAGATAQAVLDKTGRHLCDLMQARFPLVIQPYAAFARELGISEEETLRRAQGLLEAGIIRQISAIFDSRKLGYSSVLTAFCVPPDKLEIVAAGVAAHSGVSHAYQRKHALNLWFTITVPPGQDPEIESARLAERSRVTLWAPLPALRTFKIGVLFDMSGESLESDSGGQGAVNRGQKSGVRDQGVGVGGQDEEAKIAAGTAQANGDVELEARKSGLPTPDEIALIRALQQEIPINPRPFRLQAEQLSITEEELLERAQEMLTRGWIRRFAATLRHRAAGYAANGMACWSVATERLGEVGPRVAAFPEVSHCYERRPAPPLWPHNFFAMLHGHQEAAVEGVVSRIREAAGLDQGEILYSSREFKKERVIYFPE